MQDPRLLGLPPPPPPIEQIEVAVTSLPPSPWGFWDYIPDPLVSVLLLVVSISQVHKYASRRARVASEQSDRRATVALEQSDRRARDNDELEHRYKLLDAYADYFSLADQYREASRALRVELERGHVVPPFEDQEKLKEELRLRRDDLYWEFRPAGSRVDLLERDKERSELLGRHFHGLRHWCRLIGIDLTKEEKKLSADGLRESTKAGYKLQMLVKNDLGSGLPVLGMDLEEEGMRTGPQGLRKQQQPQHQSDSKSDDS